MTYDVYFHNDFDGRASAAVLRAFLMNRGDSVGSYVPVDFDIEHQWPTMVFPRPAIVVDFLYHPKAAFWFDHHTTTFKLPAWKKGFRESKYHVWDPEYPSCAHLVLDALKKNFGFKPGRHFAALVRATDIVDAAQYRSPRQTIEMKDPALQLDQFIDKQEAPLVWLIERMSEESISSIVRDKRIQRALKTIYKKRDVGLAYYRKYLHIYDRVGLLDITKKKIIDLRFAPYFFEPRLRFFIFIKKHEADYGIHLGVNPWRRGDVGSLHVGKLMMQYGGGGHQYVGACRATTREKAVDVAHKLITYLNARYA